MKTKKIIIFASGTGSNFQALHQSPLLNDIPACITALVTDNPGSGALAYARSHHIEPVILSPVDYDHLDDYILELDNKLTALEPDIIALAGYLKKIPDPVVHKYRGKIINIHPSLLPEYGGKNWYGLRVHQAVIENKDKESGCTVHYVSEIYDDGPIIAQAKVPVSDDDTAESLAKKVLKQEHKLYPKVVKQLLTDKQTDPDQTQ